MSLYSPQLSHTPFTTSNDICIVNSHYSQYGHSVLTPFEGGSYHTITSRTKRGNSVISNNSSVMVPPSKKSNNNTIHSLGSSLVEENVETTIAKPKFSYKSLLIDNNVTKFLKKTLIDADNFSIFSSKSISFNQLPIEIIKLILNFVDDYKTLIYCLYVNKNFYKASKTIIYMNPKLTSTYRVGQLISSLKENPKNGLLIQFLDLSKLTSGLILNEEYVNDVMDSNDDDFYLDYAYASWRDWKFKGDPLYGSSLLNSYNLSKTKSVISVDSMSTVTTFKLNFLQRLKFDNDITMKLKNIKNKLFIFKRNSNAKLFKKEIKTNKKVVKDEKSVKFNTRDVKNQPFYDHHPYTNKFLLKYSSSKDIPIGYVLYFLEICPNLIDLNLSKISLSDDFKIVYQDKIKQHINFTSLIEDVSPILEQRSNEVDLKPRYLSDLNINLKKISNIEYELIKLNEFEILNSISNLRNLKYLNLSSISWLNYKNLRSFNLSKKSELLEIDLIDSGMIRNLTWAKFFKINEFNEYFLNEIEPKQKEEEDENLLLIRRIGMNY